MRICGISPGTSGMRSSSTMISAPSRSTTGRACGEVERHDRDVLQIDVLPDVELGPVRQREDADRFALVHARVVRCSTVPGAGSSDPSRGWRSGTRRCAPWRALFSSSRRAPPNAASNPCCVSACLSASVFMRSRIGADVRGERRDALREAFLVGVHDQFQSVLPDHAVAEARSSPGTSTWCRCEGAGMAAGRDRTPSGQGAA